MRSILLNVLYSLLILCISIPVFGQLAGPYGAMDGVYRIPDDITAEDYLPGQVYMKVKPEFRSACDPSGIAIPAVQYLMEDLGLEKLELTFPHSPAPQTERDEHGRKLVDLSLIYEGRFSASNDIEELVNTLLSTGVFEYVEPHYLYKLFYTPNDPSVGMQYYLTLIDAFSAWDISKGDPSIAIGIIDTGTSFTHTEINENHYLNLADTIDGMDNDGDGYTDNYRGWDFVGDCTGCPPDNDPTFAPGKDHGLLVAGVASMEADNDTCFAGVGFNCKTLGLKTVVNGGDVIIKGYEAIVYAADHDIPIINNSWGGTVYTKLGEDVVNYATINKGSMVVAAGGNTPLANLLFYPASYHNCIGVAGSQHSDAVWLSSPSFGTTYNYLMDVVAPARGISTIAGASTCASFDAWSGTSLAAPMICGVAGLVKAEFPSLSNAQVAQRVRLFTDDIYGINPAVYNERLGRGRLNAYKALTMTSPAVRSIETILDEREDGVVMAGDTVDVWVKFMNYLEPSLDLSVSLSSPNTAITVLDDDFYIGALGTMDTASNYYSKFRIVVSGSASANATVYLRFEYTDASWSYTDWEYIPLTISPNIVHMDHNLVEVSIDGIGNIGTNNQGYGRRFFYDGEVNYLTNGGLLIGNSATNVSDVVPNNFGGENAHFQALAPVSRDIPGALADLQTHAVFNDNGAGGAALGIEVTHNGYQYAHDPDRDYVIHEYKIRNTTGSTLSNVYAGLFADWDLAWYTNNFNQYDSTGRLVYCWEPFLTSFNYTAIAPITLDSMHALGVPQDSFGFTTSEKWNALTSSVENANSDTTDVMMFVSQGPFNIAAGDTHTVAFVMFGGKSISELRTIADAARTKYECVIKGTIPKVELGPDLNICRNDTTLVLDAGAGYSSYLWSTGESTNSISVDSSGIYSVTVTDGSGCTDVSDIEINLQESVEAAFSASSTTVFAGDTIWFTDSSSGSVYAREWDFGDGSTAVSVDPYHHWSTPGTYDVNLKISKCGCADTATMSITVDTLVTRHDPIMYPKVDLFPNPTEGRFKLVIEYPGETNIQLQISDLAGKVWMEESLGAISSNKTIYDGDISGPSKGLYLVTINGSSFTKTIRLIK